MAFTLYLAMTAAEFTKCSSLPPAPAFMACHFSPYGTGLTDLPAALPPGSLLILNDRIPCFRQDPARVAAELAEAAAALKCGGVLLDLQRPGSETARAAAEAIVTGLDCPAAVSELYAGGLDCPVFLNMPPLEKPLEEVLAPWQGREVWMEAALTARRVDITAQGTVWSDADPRALPRGRGFDDEGLLCRYLQTQKPDAVSFYLFSDREILEKRMKQAEKLGVRRFVGLYQQLGGESVDMGR